MTTVADHIAQRIRETGARHAFGIPGGEVLTVMDALARAGIAFHLVKHETAGGFMADAVAQLTRTPGVLVGTIGPGVTNLVTRRRPRLSRPHAHDRAHRGLRRGHHGDLHASGLRPGRAARADHQVQRHARGARRGRARRPRDCARHQRRARTRPSERPGARGRRRHGGAARRPAAPGAGRSRRGPRARPARALAGERRAPADPGRPRHPPPRRSRRARRTRAARGRGGHHDLQGQGSDGRGRSARDRRRRALAGGRSGAVQGAPRRGPDPVSRLRSRRDARLLDPALGRAHRFRGDRLGAQRARRPSREARIRRRSPAGAGRAGVRDPRSRGEHLARRAAGSVRGEIDAALRPPDAASWGPHAVVRPAGASFRARLSPPWTRARTESC